MLRNEEIVKVVGGPPHGHVIVNVIWPIGICNLVVRQNVHESRRSPNVAAPNKGVNIAVLVIPDSRHDVAAMLIAMYVPMSDLVNVAGGG